MSDDRLFASNNAIGRKWYFINIVILGIITLFTNVIFQNYIIPNARTETYEWVAKIILYFVFAIYLITFFALIDRRLFDVSGERETKLYKNISSILKFIVFVQIIAIYCQWKNPQLPISVASITSFATFLDVIFLLIVILLGFFKGKITNLTYDEYKRRTRYK